MEENGWKRGRFYSLFLSMESTNLGLQEQTSLVVFIQQYSGPTVGFPLGPTEHW